MGSVTSIGHHSDETALIENMTAELQAIRTRVKTVEQQSAYLAGQISLHAQRHSFISSALQESQIIADVIGSSAEQRVNSVTAGTQSIVAPQQAQIIELEQAIIRLGQEVASRHTDSPAADIPASLQIVPLKRHPDNIIDLSTYIDLPPQPEDIGIPAAEADICAPIQPLSAGGAAQLEEGSHEAAIADDMRVDSQSGLDAENQEQSPTDDIDGTTAEFMQLETDLHICHIHATKEWHRPKHSHHWRLQVKAVVPEEKADAVYIHVLESINSTLKRFDDVLLNRVFPFNLIDPNNENIAAYFFNSLEDTLVMQELILKELVVIEEDTPIMTIESRNTEIEEMMKGEDLIQQMRNNLLDKSKQGEIEADRPVKKRFGFFKRN